MTRELERHGQALWLAHLRRWSVSSGELERLIETDGVGGVSFDLDLFADLVSSDADYADGLDALLQTETDAVGIVDELIAADVGAACRLFQGQHERGRDRGWVAVDLPDYAMADTDAAAAWFDRLAEAAGARNVILKVPATSKGLAIAERVMASGGSVQLTDIFAPAQIEAVIEAHRRGLDLCMAAGHDVSSVRVSAAINLVRIDVAVDEMLRSAAVRDADNKDLIESLIGRAAIAVAARAWDTVRTAIGGSRWRSLTVAGARPLQLAWEGALTGDPARRDVEYMEELIGTDTVVVASRAALAAFRHHGIVGATLEDNLGGARELLSDLADVGVDLESLASDLQTAAVKQASERMAALCNRIEAWREGSRAARGDGATYALGPLRADTNSRLESFPTGFVQRLWDRDPSLWTADKEQQAAVRNRLGWLGLAETMREEALPILGSARASESHPVPVVLLGMGGSGLGAETCRAAYEASGFTLLDTTVPRGVAAVAARVQIDQTVFIVGSKSGTTAETDALADYFYARAAAESEDPGARFVAITDPGTPLHEKARKHGYAKVWLNPPDVGGRYSVLSYFGLVPMALMGIDLGAILDRAALLVAQSGPEVPLQRNPAVALGAVLAAAASTGRDKITFCGSSRLTGFADWAEQLIAESLGKSGIGVVPISAEPLGSPDAYGEDRLFVNLRFATDDVDAETRDLLDSLERRGHPRIDIELSDPHDLGREFMRWELGVAVAGALLGINPFDEPDVRGAKERTAELLAAFDAQGSLPEPEAVFEGPAVAVIAGPDVAARLGAPRSLAEWLGAHLGQARVPDYVAIQAFLAPEIETWHGLQGLRALIRDVLGVATTVGWGPRFLHSTGQLHKGGPDTGVFLQITASDSGDVEIPGRGYGFGVLARAQSLGDLMALQACSRRVLRLYLRGEVEAGLAAVLEAATTGLKTRGPKGD